MGKYTSLVRSFRDVEPLVFSPKGAKERGILNKDIYIYMYINIMKKNRERAAPPHREAAKNRYEATNYEFNEFKTE